MGLSLCDSLGNSFKKDISRCVFFLPRGPDYFLQAAGGSTFGVPKKGSLLSNSRCEAGRLNEFVSEWYDVWEGPSEG